MTVEQCLDEDIEQLKESKRKYDRLNRRLRLKRGLCPNCNRELLPPYKVCLIHKAAQIEGGVKERQRAAELRKAGICVDCKQAPINKRRSTRSCTACLWKWLARQDKRQERISRKRARIKANHFSKAEAARLARVGEKAMARRMEVGSVKTVIVRFPYARRSGYYERQLVHSDERANLEYEGWLREHTQDWLTPFEFSERVPWAETTLRAKASQGLIRAIKLPHGQLLISPHEVTRMCSIG